MTQKEKSALIAEIIALLEMKIKADSGNFNIEKKLPQKVEMLTIKECAEIIKGLSEHTLRQLIARGRIPFIRTGQGKNGKILISKTALINYFEQNGAS